MSSSSWMRQHALIKAYERAQSVEEDKQAAFLAAQLAGGPIAVMLTAAAEYEEAKRNTANTIMALQESAEPKPTEPS